MSMSCDAAMKRKIHLPAQINLLSWCLSHTLGMFSSSQALTPILTKAAMTVAMVWAAKVSLGGILT